MVFADVIVDISQESLDKTYQYIVNPKHEEDATIGALVTIPFGAGNRTIQGYIVGLSNKPCISLTKMKELLSVRTDGIVIESQLITLAYWIKRTYGSTMNEALKTVLPVKKTVRHVEKRYVELNVTKEKAKEVLLQYQKKNYKGRIRLLEALLANENPEAGIDTSTLKEAYNISNETIKGLIREHILVEKTERIYRNPVKQNQMKKDEIVLNEEQKNVVENVLSDYMQGIRNTYLVHGVTGSGKTEVYMEIIGAIKEKGKQVIFLIPEIALTYQTVMRFYERFGDAVSILNSRMSQGERYDQYLRAKNGEISIMIGPRSALFTPFSNLGLIIIDEEHETSYKSEGVPKYHARETAIYRAKLANASVILGSATPTVVSYYKAKCGEYKLFTLKNRANAAELPPIDIVDLREELKQKNKSIFSARLRELMEEKLNKKEQIMLFINRRGYAGFVSCRSCGHVIKCPHCDVSLTSHKNGQLICHYCGYETKMVKLCPSCGSPFIAAFGIGTQKIEEQVKKEFPQARVLRMDMDTTTGKQGHQSILERFYRHDADILVGTQMIVKGHDFKDVTLVGVLAADLSLYAGNFLAAERTFALLCQASGRAGRGEKPGNVVIQTYNPDHYSIRFAATHDYESFYEEEILYRKMLDYLPFGHLSAILFSGCDEAVLDGVCKEVGNMLIKEASKLPGFKIIGPTKASLSKANDYYRRIIYIKNRQEGSLLELLQKMEAYVQALQKKDIYIQIDFEPLSGY
ncbi:MAG: hypothetical protein PWP24_1557 [Clostridiales bacterium]|nr:hypothetical protein [Clostridiales bacterium]